MSASAVTMTDAPAPALAALAGQGGEAPLTRVSLAYYDQRLKVYLRFGEPLHIARIDRWRRVAVFASRAVLARVRWQANAYGTVRWQLMVLHTCRPDEIAQRIAGVVPGARLLLHVEGDAAVRTVLAQIDAIEALGMAPVDVAPAYWRTLGNRLAAHLPLPAYTAERHAAWLAGRALR
ncbi:DUF2840 domain-containing protein [Pseudoxanthomonas winnipegensis]|jgi:hypothetical protein|uniref:Transposase n=1 Tax=Rhodanobacter denitrificans TaxID=666685 RepID=A0A2W5KA15_9GAMM|nr:DUF2840 domain-containing protein [Pseudoxanthomonas winnipegensis]PZQ13952.1 MAG: transposase [Rhodanobacter denitrificans]RZZ90204.1 DUF2840 domain-containing protein [Pseudoxanthomonas winnipegensis]